MDVVLLGDPTSPLLPFKLLDHFLFIPDRNLSFVPTKKKK